jgi:hypothetical protein
VNADQSADSGLAAGRLGAALAAAPSGVAALGGVVVVAGTQGGYFPTSWAPSAIVLLSLLAVWLVAGGRTDAGRLDVAFLGLLAALAGWIAASLLWSDAPAQTALELQRAIVPLAGTAAVLVLAGRSTYRHTAFGLLAGIVVVSGYGLATRLFPDRLGVYHPVTGYRLSEPIGYWNGLGLIAVVGALLALGIGAEATKNWQRGAAASALVVLAPTAYFTFSRGAWLALAAGAAAVFLFSPRRLATIGAWCVLLPAPGIAIAAASQAEALTHQREDLSNAVTQGRWLAGALIGLAVVAFGAGVGITRLQARIALTPPQRRLVGGTLLGAVVLVVFVGLARAGGPGEAAHRASEAFAAAPAATETDLNNRLFSLSGNGRGDLWREALSEYEANPVLGSGAGTFERYWQRNPEAGFKARDAHSLYLETLGELGPVGLSVLLGALAVPFAACLAARRSPVVPAALGAYVAYIVHTAYDWDWELTGVTLAGLLAGCVGLLAHRTEPPRRIPRAARVAGVGTTVALALLLGVGYVGSDALERAEVALGVGNPSAALAEADNARKWTPWSPYPQTVRGEALLDLGRVQAARGAFEDAIGSDPGYWRAWLGLAVASRGSARAVALRHARRLYPRSAEVAETERLLRPKAR